MKKILILLVMVFGLVACGEKFPYTSKSEKEKMLKEFQVAAKKADETKDKKDILVAKNKLSEIIKIITELEKRSEDGDEKAKEESEKWQKMVRETEI